MDYAKLVQKGCCFACGGEVIDYGFVEDFILSLPEKYGVEIARLGYDRYNAISTVQKLEAAEIECVDIKQHSSVLHPAAKLLKECVLNRTFCYDENRLLEINFQNARCTEDTNLNTVSYTHLDVYKRQRPDTVRKSTRRSAETAGRSS